LLFRTTGFATGDPLSRGGMGNIAQIPLTSMGFIKKIQVFLRHPSEMPSKIGRLEG
jgi:hypothetical protein